MQSKSVLGTYTGQTSGHQNNVTKQWQQVMGLDKQYFHLHHLWFSSCGLVKTSSTKLYYWVFSKIIIAHLVKLVKLKMSG